MRPIRDIIVKVDKAYNSEIKLKSGLVLFLDQNIKQVKDTVRYGEVVAIPEGLNKDIRVGDTLFFHHGIVAVTVMDGQEDIQSEYLVSKKEGLYRVPVNDRWPMMYATVRDGEFRSLDGICFVRGLTKQKYQSNLLVIPGNETEVRHIGEMVYSNQTLEAKGVVPGTKVVYEKDSEYRFNVNGEELYCMFDKWILGIYEG